jgi:hypothetical protein
MENMNSNEKKEELEKLLKDRAKVKLVLILF